MAQESRTAGSRGNKVKIIKNPLYILNQISKSYPKLKDIEVVFSFMDKGWGKTDGKTIIININLRLYNLPEILAHEMAHCIVGVEHKHDDVWDKEFSKIQKAFAKIAKGEK